MLKITKKEKLLEARRPVAVDYWLIHGRIYNDDGSAYYRFKFVIDMDLELDTYDAETGEIIPYNDALEMLIDSFCDYAGDAFNNDAARADFFDNCNNTIACWNSGRNSCWKF